MNTLILQAFRLMSKQQLSRLRARCGMEPPTDARSAVSAPIQPETRKRSQRPSFANLDTVNDPSTFHAERRLAVSREEAIAWQREERLKHRDREDAGPIDSTIV